MRLSGLLFLLSGCGSVVPSTLAVLDQADPLRDDPAGFAVALDLPTGLDIEPGTSFLVAEVTTEGESPVTLSVRLQETTDVAGRRNFSIAPADQAALRQFQALALTWKEAAPRETEGSFAVTLGLCRTAPAAALEGSRVSVFLRTEPDGPMLPLVRNGPISAVADRGDLATLPACP